MKEWYKKITGKTVEEKIDNYTELYGEILLGIHREVESQKRFINQHQRGVEEYLQHIVEAHGSVALISNKVEETFEALQEHNETFRNNLIKEVNAIVEKAKKEAEQRQVQNETLRSELMRDVSAIVEKAKKEAEQLQLTVQQQHGESIQAQQRVDKFYRVALTGAGLSVVSLILILWKML